MAKTIKVTLGGDRIGSGNKMQQRMRNFDRASFNIGKIWASSVAPGVVTPCFVDFATIGTTYEMRINDLVRTIPTNGPLFGSFIGRVEVYFFPLRLTQGILHNNPIALGMNANQVLLPMANVELTKKSAYDQYIQEGGNMPVQHASAGVSSLINYLGAQALPLSYTSDDETMQVAAGPMLGYYDIIKNYHCNKQEENAYVITNQKVHYFSLNIEGHIYGKYAGGNIPWERSWKIVMDPQNIPQTITTDVVGVGIIPDGQNMISIRTYIQNPNQISISLTPSTQITTVPPKDTDEVSPWLWLGEPGTPLKLTNSKKIYTDSIGPVYEHQFIFQTTDGQWPSQWGAKWVSDGAGNAQNGYLYRIGYRNGFDGGVTRYGLQLTPFPIKNFDKARYTILDNNSLNQRVTIDPRTSTNKSTSINFLPYSVNVETNEVTGISRNADSMNGLCVKCYQSDLFNNWLNTEWVDGPNGINELSAIPVVDGKIKVDSLIIHKKVYQMLNRTIINDGTYHGYQEALWGESAWKEVESAIYCGGMSSEIVFEEVVSNSASDAGGESAPLGTLGGRGRAAGKKGGEIKIRVDEAGYIIAVYSITPRIMYDSACKYYMTELKTFADLHNPNLDQIGFQNLPVRQMAGWSGAIGSEMSAGKQPSWIQYQTNYDTVHGDFAMPLKAGFMVLSRSYDAIQDGNGQYVVGDLTTYIDPTKYNEAFAQKALEAQNFWVQLKFDVIARRKMSANQIPNL